MGGGVKASMSPNFVDNNIGEIMLFLSVVAFHCRGLVFKMRVFKVCLFFKMEIETKHAADVIMMQVVPENQDNYFRYLAIEVSL